jgi:hypothetical protein
VDISDVIVIGDDDDDFEAPTHKVLKRKLLEVTNSAARSSSSSSKHSSARKSSSSVSESKGSHSKDFKAPRPMIANSHMYTAATNKTKKPASITAAAAARTQLQADKSQPTINMSFMTIAMKSNPDRDRDQ